MAGTSYFRYREEAERELLTSGAWRERMQRIGDEIAADARRDAPVGHPSQGGAASIHGETILDPRTGWEARVSWDRRHFYMYFREKGTKYQQARPFLRPAIERAARNI